MSYLEECVGITGAVIDGDYRDYSFAGGYFTPDGTIIDNQKNGHPLFELALSDKIQLEFGGHLEMEKTVEQYLADLSRECPSFGRT